MSLERATLNILPGSYVRVPLQGNYVHLISTSGSRDKLRVRNDHINLRITFESISAINTGACFEYLDFYNDDSFGVVIEIIAGRGEARDSGASVSVDTMSDSAAAALATKSRYPTKQLIITGNNGGDGLFSVGGVTLGLDTYSHGHAYVLRGIYGFSTPDSYRITLDSGFTSAGMTQQDPVNYTITKSTSAASVMTRYNSTTAAAGGSAEILAYNPLTSGYNRQTLASIKPTITDFGHDIILVPGSAITLEPAVPTTAPKATLYFEQVKVPS